MRDYKDDANDRCMERHVMDTTGTGWGQSAENCASVPWFVDRRLLDAVRVARVAVK
jgi:hypothetical protein